MAIDTVGFLSKTAEKLGFIRETFNEGQIPTDPSSIAVMPFFGDIRSLFILSSLILKCFKEREKASRYFILCSWPGYSGLFPYANEYWSIKDSGQMANLYSFASGFKNRSDIVSNLYRELNTYFFEDIVFADTGLNRYYNFGLTDSFWEDYKKRFLPTVPSSAILEQEFLRQVTMRRGFKVFIYPTIFVPTWKLNSISMVQVHKNFWISLVDRLLKEDFTPVVCKSFLTYDLSSHFMDQCIFFSEQNIGRLLAAMRLVGCVVDFFSGISRLALAARCPFISFTERSYYMALKEYELDDICGEMLPKRYIFSFPTIIEGGTRDAWEFNLYDNLIVKLNDFLSTLDREAWPTTGESYEIISYDKVRKRNQKRFGTKFIKINR